MVVRNDSQFNGLIQSRGADRTANVTRSNATVSTAPVSSFGREATNTRPNPKDYQGRNSDNKPSRNQQRLPYGGSQAGQARTGFVLTSDLWNQEGKSISLHAGPASASWTLPLRAQDEENKGGHARYAQARSARSGGHNNPDLTYFDFPKVSFQFQAGNILPIFGYQDEISMANGLRDFHQFMELLNQPPLLPAGVNEGKHNYTWIFYTSLQFPQITLKGYFDPEGLSWEENADNPGLLNWTSGFTVYEMTPNIWEASEMEDIYSEEMKKVTRFF